MRTYIFHILIVLPVQHRCNFPYEEDIQEKKLCKIKKKLTITPVPDQKLDLQCLLNNSQKLKNLNIL